MMKKTTFLAILFAVAGCTEETPISSTPDQGADLSVSDSGQLADFSTDAAADTGMDAGDMPWPQATAETHKVVFFDTNSPVLSPVPVARRRPSPTVQFAGAGAFFGPAVTLITLDLQPPSPQSRVCTTAERCICPDGSESQKICRLDGLSLSDCVCPADAARFEAERKNLGYIAERIVLFVDGAAPINLWIPLVDLPSFSDDLAPNGLVDHPEWRLGYPWVASIRPTVGVNGGAASFGGYVKITRRVIDYVDGTVSMDIDLSRVQISVEGHEDERWFFRPDVLHVNGTGDQVSAGQTTTPGATVCGRYTDDGAFSHSSYRKSLCQTAWTDYCEGNRKGVEISCAALGSKFTDDDFSIFCPYCSK